MVKISAWGTGLAAILGAGAVLLAALKNDAWSAFLFTAVVALVISIVLRKMHF